MSSQLLTGHKRRISNSALFQQTPRHSRRRSSTNRDLSFEERNLLYEKTSCSTHVPKSVMRNQVPGVRIKQTNNSGLEKVYQLATVKENMMKEYTLRPTERQRTTPRPPLSRRPVIGRNRANSGVGIVRCRSWQLNAEDTETEDECAGSKDSPRTVVQLPAFGRAKVVKMRMATGDCGCSEVGKSCANENVDDPAGKSALSIDSSRLCFTRHMNEDSWQLHLFSPDALDEV